MPFGVATGWRREALPKPEILSYPLETTVIDSGVINAAGVTADASGPYEGRRYLLAGTILSKRVRQPVRAVHGGVGQTVAGILFDTVEFADNTRCIGRTGGVPASQRQLQRGQDHRLRNARGAAVRAALPTLRVRLRGGESMPGFDIYDQAVLTALVNEPVDTALESAPQLGSQIAPLNNINARMARMDVGRTYSFGIGQYKAPNAMPALVEMPVTERREALIEMVQLEEMHRINSEQWMRLQSTDENIRNAEGLDVMERGSILRRRLERLTEQQRWQVFVNGSLTITYPRTNSQLVVDYGWLPGHKPTAGDVCGPTRPLRIRWPIWKRGSSTVADDAAISAR